MSVSGAPSSTRPSCNSAAFETITPKASGSFSAEEDFDDYQDLEAHYHERPSAWIAPKGNWGAGCAQLVEIPTRAEYFDNIVAFWRPDAALVAGQTCSFGLPARLVR